MPQEIERQEILATVAELAALIEADAVTVMDCRFRLLEPDWGRQAFLEGHIPGSVYADLDRDLSAAVTPTSGRHPLPAPEAATDFFRKAGVGKARTVVVYDDMGGAIAARAWWMLRWLGHPDTRLLDGGYPAWTAAGMPAEQGVSSSGTGNFAGTAAQGWVADTVDIESGSSGLLCDARDAVRFQGREEPIDAVAGHVPGAINTPFTHFLSGDGRVLPTERLRAVWVELLGQQDATEWTVMCGSGVTACHLAITGLIAGRPMPRLYAGSWSEWIRGPGRPVAGGAG